MVTWTRVLGEKVAQGKKLVGSELAGDNIRDVYLQRLPRPLIDETRASVRVSVGIGDVGLNIVDRRAIHQVSTKYVDDWRLTASEVYFVNAHTRKADGIGAERRTRGEDPNALVATKTWRTDGEASVIVAAVSRKLPDEPQVIKILQATHGLGMAIVMCKNNASWQCRCYTTLSRYAEFRRQRRTEKGNGIYIHA